MPANRYVELVGEPRCPARIVPNGLYRHEFYEPMLADDAVDFVFVGELRYLKGVDVLLEALAAHQAVFPGRALIVGSGPDEAGLKRLARRLGLNGRVSFSGAAVGAQRLCPRPLRGGAGRARNPFPISCSRPPRRRCR